jgi:hypothetical protein
MLRSGVRSATPDTYVLSHAVQSHEIAPRDAKSKSTLFNFVNIVATNIELRYFKAERSARRLGLYINITGCGGVRGKMSYLRMRLAQVVESWHCGLGVYTCQSSFGGPIRKVLTKSSTQFVFSTKQFLPTKLGPKSLVTR